MVRDELVKVAGEELLTVAGERPHTVDVRDLARLRVTAAGDVEWAIAGSNSRAAVIETDEERRERTATERRRQEAVAHVDWTRVRDVSREPEFAYTDSDGCWNLLLYGWSGDRTEAIGVQADIARLPVTASTSVLDVAELADAISIVVHVFKEPSRSLPFCTDVITFVAEEEWRAVSGILTITRSEPGVRAGQPASYRATVRIDGAAFTNAAGLRVRPTMPIVLSGIVDGSPRQ